MQTIVALRADCLALLRKGLLQTACNYYWVAEEDLIPMPLSQVQSLGCVQDILRLLSTTVNSRRVESKYRAGGAS